MIRINLLPEPRTKGGKKQWDVRIEAVGACAAILLAVIACFWYAGVLNDANDTPLVAAFSHIANLSGGREDDRFTIAQGGTLSGRLDGGEQRAGSINTLVGSSLANGSTFWTKTGPNGTTRPPPSKRPRLRP